MIDFDITKCTKKCFDSGREILPGETLVSALIQEGSQIERRDFAEEAWSEPPEGCIGWWRTQIPEAPAATNKMPPPEILVRLYDELSNSEATNEGLRFVLALLLIRKRLLREEPMLQDSDESSMPTQWWLQCGINGETYEQPILNVGNEYAIQLQDELVQLLYGISVEATDDSENEATESDSYSGSARGESTENEPSENDRE